MDREHTAVDTLLHPDWIVPVVPEGEVLRDHSLAITGGEISAILPRAQASKLEAKQELELTGHSLLPGLINGHGHAAMSLLRGFADDLPLMPWLEDHIWPAEADHVSEEFVADGVMLAIAEMLRCGTTTFSDMYFFPDITARIARETGMRCQITFPIFDFPTIWARDADEYIQKGLDLRNSIPHEGLISLGFGPHAPYTVSEPSLAKVAALSAEADMVVQIHLHETSGEVLRALEANGERPLAALHRLGLLGPRTQCVHMTSLGQPDIELLAHTGAHVIHCPQSNMKLASGTCPVTKLLAAGVNVALGTDGAASNNDLNMFGEMQAAALLAKLDSQDATALPAAQALTMATIAGARAMGLDDRIGSLEVGKQADLIAVDLSQPETQPMYNALSQLVYACNGSQVSHSWIAGKPVMQQRELVTINQSELAQRVTRWQHKISA